MSDGPMFPHYSIRLYGFKRQIKRQCKVLSSCSREKGIEGNGDTKEWSRQDMYWTDARKLMLPDAKAVSVLMEIDYVKHGQMEALIQSPNG